jgi:hypothetical protein
VNEFDSENETEDLDEESELTQGEAECISAAAEGSKYISQDRKFLENEEIPGLPRLDLEEQTNDSSQECTDRPATAYDTQRQQLLELAEGRFSGQQLQTFQSDMRAFEQRLSSGNPRMTAEQIARTYDQVIRLMSSTGDRQQLMATIGGQVLRNAATPSGIEQFPFPTCQTAVQENILYSKNPERAAQIVADIALTGSHRYTVSDRGRTYTIDSESRTPAFEEAVRYPPPDNHRSMASQLFQVTAANMAMDSIGWNSRYIQRPGEHVGLYDMSTTPPRKEKWKVGHRDVQIGMANVLGLGADGMFIAPHSDLEPPINQFRYFRTEQELGTALAQAQANNRMPIVLSVAHTSAPNGNHLEWAGAHVVVIRSYQAGPPPRVEYDDQLGSRRDRLGSNAISLNQIFRMTQFPDNIGTVNSDGLNAYDAFWEEQRRRRPRR